MDGYPHFIEATAGESPIVNRGFLAFLFSSIKLLLWSLLSLKSPFQVILEVLLTYTSSFFEEGYKRRAVETGRKQTE